MDPSQNPTPRLRRLDRQHVWHPFTPMKSWAEADPLVITSAQGMHLIDGDGNRYLDGVSSLWCNVHGHRVPEIDEAIRSQLDKVAHTTMLGLASEPAILLAERLMRIVPPGLTKVFYSDAGATAAEVAFKLAAQYWYNVGQPERTQFVGFAEAYHGDTVGAMSIGRIPAFHKPYFPLLFPAHFAPTPYVYRFDRALLDSRGRKPMRPNADAPRPGASLGAEDAGASARGYQGPAGADADSVRDACLASLEQILGEHGPRIAAICIEPIVQGAGGIIVQPPGFLRGVAGLAKSYGTLLIADEVATGFGRTGRMFACGHEGVAPDLMCVAKGITGGYLPLAATFATQAIFDAFLGEPWEGKTFYHGHTYTGNPLACAAALASLDLFDKNDVIGNVTRNAPVLAEMLNELRDLPHVGDVRQMGYMVGIELVADKETREPFDPRRRVGAGVCMSARRHGVIVRPLGDVVVLMPPPAMGVEDLRAIIAAVRMEIAGLQKVEGWRIEDGGWRRKAGG